MQISGDSVPLNPNKEGLLEILCVKWCKNAALEEHCISVTYAVFRSYISFA